MRSIKIVIGLQYFNQEYWTNFSNNQRFIKSFDYFNNVFKKCVYSLGLKSVFKGIFEFFQLSNKKWIYLVKFIAKEL